MNLDEALGQLSALVYTKRARIRLESLWDWLGKGTGTEQDKLGLLRAEAMRAHPRLCDYLAHRLAKEKIKVGDEDARLMEQDLGRERLRVPVCLVPHGETVGADKPGELSNRFIRTKENGDSSQYVQLRERMGAKLATDNRRVFVADCIEQGESRRKPVALSGALSYYKASLADEDALEFELLEAGLPLNCSEPDFDELDKKLKLRQQAERDIKHNLLQGGGRSNAIAVSTLIVYKRLGGGYRVLVRRRTNETANHGGLFHVVPAGMFEPEHGDVDTEWSLLHNVLKEYAEELFKKEHVETTKGSANYFYTKWDCVRQLREKLRTGACLFKVTGLVVSPLNLRPEACTLLFIRDARWWANQWADVTLNWEYLSLTKIRDSREKALADFDLDNAEEEFLREFGSESHEWVPAGLAALWLGIEAARQERDHQRVRNWLAVAPAVLSISAIVYGAARPPYESHFWTDWLAILLTSVVLSGLSGRLSRPLVGFWKAIAAAWASLFLVWLLLVEHQGSHYPHISGSSLLSFLRQNNPLWILFWVILWGAFSRIGTTLRNWLRSLF